MRNPLRALGVAGVLMLTFGWVLVAQNPQAQEADNPQNLSNRYEKLKEKKDPGGPVPRRDLNGAWAGPTAVMTTVPAAMTPLGRKMFSPNKPEGPQAEPGTQVPVALSNDPLAV